MGEGALRSFNIAQSGNRTRLVMNLTKPLVYETKIEGKILFISLRDETTGNITSGTTAHFTEDRTSEQELSLRDVDSVVVLTEKVVYRLICQALVPELMSANKVKN